LELTLETLMALAGLVIYCKLPGSSKHARVGMCVYVLLLTGLTWTQLFSTVAPTHRELVTTWIVAPIVFALVRYLLDRKRVAALAA
jgi:tryptophan-rich sensory protein